MANFSREAHQQSLSFVRDEASLHAGELSQAVDAFCADDWDALPQPNTPEAHEFIDRTKPERFAYLARVIGTLIETTFDKRGERPPLGLVHLEDKNTDTWKGLRASFKYTLCDDIERIGDTSEFQKSGRISRLIGTLDSERFIDTGTHLTAGIDTCFSTFFPLLQNLPSIAAHHQPGFDPEQLPNLAQGCGNLAFDLAKRSVRSMMGAKAILANTTRPLNFEDKPLSPEMFIPVFRGKELISLRFENLEDQNIPEGFYTFRISPMSAGVPLKEFDISSTTVVGCPVTLLSGRLKQLWYWTVDAVDQAGLWKNSATT